MLHFDQLHTFITVVKSGGFRAASETLHRTQPAVTAAVKQLEDQLGFKLFDRSQYRPTLTQRGQALHDKALILIEQMQHLEHYSQQLQQGVEIEFTIAIDVLAPLEIYLPVFKYFIEHYPNTHFHFLNEALGGASERLLNQTASIAITENLISEQETEVIPLQAIPMIPVATPSYLKTNKKLLKDPMQIKHCTQVILRDSSSQQDKFNFGVVENAHHWTVSDIYSKKQIISNSMGWGRLPKHLINNELQQGTLVALQGEHFDTRVMQLSAIRLQHAVKGQLNHHVWRALQTLNQLKINATQINQHEWFTT